MKSIGMNNRNIVKVAGFMFLLAFIGPTLNWAFTLSKFIVKENVMVTANNVMANPLLFRVGITIELFMAVCLIILALVLYRILKQISKNLALLALLLKLVEATIVVAIVLISFIALQILDEQSNLTSFTPDQLKIPVGFILNSHTLLYSIPMVFLGIDMMIFTYLFFKSRYIPRIIAVFGFLSFALILIHSLMYIIAPDYAALWINQIIFYAPSGIFELVIGTWLLTKGINSEQWKKHGFDAAAG